MKQDIITKKGLKEKSIAYQIPFANLLEGFLRETLMFQILEEDFSKNLWLKNRDCFTLDTYKKEWQKPLHFVYKQEKRKTGQPDDVETLKQFFRNLGQKREDHVRWDVSVETKDDYQMIYITGEWEAMKVPITLCVTPMLYEMIIPEKQELCSLFYEKKCVQYEYFPLDIYLAEQLFAIIKYMELIPSMEVYETVCNMLKRETIDGRHIFETIEFLCRKEGMAIDMQRIHMLESYKDYTYMKKRWEKYEKTREKKSDLCPWEDVIESIHAFLSPIWQAVCRDEVFFGDWMPDLGRYL